jgi:Protein of unknown function (DUF2853)
MNKFEEALESYKAVMTEAGFEFDETLLTAVTKGLGPSIYNKDSSLVSATDPEEVARVKTNYLLGKLGLEDSADVDAGLASVMEQVKGIRMKPRAIVYYLLCKHFGKEGVYAAE